MFKCVSISLFSTMTLSMVLLLAFANIHPIAAEPFMINSAKTAIIAGTVSTSFAFDSLDSQSLKLIDIPCQPELSLSAVFAQHISESTVGVYNELVSTVFVQNKDAPILPLKCLASTEQSSIIDFVMETLQAINLANQHNLAMGLALQYGMYTNALLVNNHAALQVGIERWGFPKQKRDMMFNVTDTQYTVKVFGLRSEEGAINIQLNRDVSALSPLAQFVLNGDFFVPESLAPRGLLPQMHGIIGNNESSSSYIYPFTGSIETTGMNGHMSYNTFSWFLHHFSPALVIELEDAFGIFNPNRAIQ